MTHPTELDLGPLAWVKNEIDAALARADESLEQAADSADAPARVQFAQTHLHQVRGALSIVGLDGLAQFASSLDQTLALLSRGERPIDSAVLALSRRALATIGNYLEELVHGTPDQPLRLLPLYTDIGAVRGAESVSPVDLFFPDLSVRAPRSPSASVHIDDDARQQQQRARRAAFQRGLLQWLRNPGDDAGPREMLDAVVAVEALHAGTPAATLWHVAQAFLEAIVHRDLPPSPEIKRLCSQLDAQLKRTGDAPAAVPERLLRELLYWTSQVPAHSARQRSVRATWHLEALLPEPGFTVSATPLAPLLKSLQGAMSSAKLAWDSFSSGHAADLPRFESLLSELTAQAPQLGRPALDRLLRTLLDFVQWLRKDPLRSDDIIALEVATALLLGETALQRGAPDNGFSAQVADTESRLRALMRGEAIAPSENSCTVETARRSQERDALRQLSREILSSLAQVEQTLDDYFRNHQKRAPLANLAAPLRQVEGTLTLLGDGDAIVLVHSAAETIAALAEAETPPSPDALESLARQLSALGFYVEALQHGPADLARFLGPATATGREPEETSAAPGAELPVEAASGHALGETGAGAFIGTSGAAPAADIEALQTDDDQPVSAPAVHGAPPQTVPERAFEPPAAAPILAPAAPPAGSAGDAEAVAEGPADLELPAAAAADGVLEKTFALLDEIDLELSPVTPADDDAVGRLRTGPEAEPVATAAAPLPVAPAPEPRAGAQDIDAELLDIFIEEAHDVLATIVRLGDALRDEPRETEHLTGIRRGFHTLKGSGRMVGLRDLGDAAWGIEQTLNRWLQLEWMPTPALHQLIADAHREFSEWVRALEAGGSQARDVGALMAEAERLRSSDTPIVAPPESASAAATVATEAAAPETTAPEPATFETATPETATLETATAPEVPGEPAPVIEDFSLSAFAGLPADEERRAPAFAAGPAFDFDLELESGTDFPAGDGEGILDLDAIESLDLEDFALPEAGEVVVAAAVAGEIDLPPEETSPAQPAEPAAGVLPRDYAAGAGTDQRTTEELPTLAAETPDSGGITSSIFDFGDLPGSEDDAEAMASAVEAASDRLDAADTLALDERTGQRRPADDFEAVALDSSSVPPLNAGTLAPDEPIESEATGALLREPLAVEAPEDVLPESRSPDTPAASFEHGLPAPATAEPEPASPDCVRIGDIEVSRPLYDLYLGEARHHLAVLHAELARLKANPTLVPAEQALRAAHTLAGISGTTRLVPVHSLARALEHAVERLHDHGLAPTAEQAALLNTTNDTLEAMLAEVSGRKMPLDVPELAEQLDSVGREVSLETLGEADDALSSAVPPARSGGSAGEAAEPSVATPVVHDDLDAQLLPIFLEEGADLVGQLHAALRSWNSADGDDGPAKSVARLLHTLKGSARMAGAMMLGEHVHKLESRLQAGQETGTDAKELIDALVAGLDLAEQMFDRIAAGEPVVAEPSPAEGQTTEADGAVSPAEADATAAVTTLRVRAEAVDRFVNAAGEIGIARTRIAGELRTMRRSLLDLTENVIRLRNQLREVEIQADVQMQSRITHAGAHDGDFDPLEMDRYTRLQELTRMMAESVGDVTTVQQNLLRNLDGTELALNNQARLSRDLQQSLMQVRMVPFDSLADRLHRVVRQTAKELGKRANLDLRGGRIEIDRSVLEHMTAPLEHLLRNAIAHGIETPAQRRDAGKDEIGQITLTVAQEGNEVAIVLADDGGGLDFARIAERARASGLLEPDEAADDRRLTNLIFIPGFSTAGNLSAVSGRGVGMDVVKSETAAVGGRIDIQAASGSGTEFRIYLPLTLAVTQALLIRAGGATYAVPSSMVAQVLELKTEALAALQRDGGTDWQGQRFAYRYLPHLLGDRLAQPQTQRFNWVLLLRAGAQTLALHVDALRGNQEIVVKNAGPQLARIVGISGATVLGDGEIVLILNPVALASRSLSAPSTAVAPEAANEASEALEPLEPFEAAIDTVPTVMVVDDSLTVRKITGRLLEREGYRVVTAKDGVDALERLIEVVPDVILSDIEMPRMDGFDLLRNIRADERLREIPVVMITSRLADKHRQYAEKIGASHYLGKPYEETELLGLLQRYTAKSVPA